MPLLLFSPGIEFLSADGRLSPADGRSPGRRTAVVLLARELCAFEHRPGAGQSSAAVLAAASAHASAASPYVQSETLIRREGPDAAIWWWDQAATAAPLRRRFGNTLPKVLPETLAQPPGQGWRIVRLSHGHEAQFWRGGVLIASSWRALPFTQEAWTAFTRVLREPDAPAEPPPSQPLPISDQSVRAALARQLTPKDAAVAALAVCAAGLVLIGAFLLGQGLRLGRETEDLRRAAAEIPAPRTVGGAAGSSLESYRALASAPDPVRALSTAMGVAALYGADPVAYAVDTRQVTLTLPYTAVSSLSRIAAELRDSGLFSEIRPSTDTEAGTIELRLTLTDAAPLNPDG